jgi:hypothetical protein
MLPPQKPSQHMMSPTIANGSWDNLLALNGNISNAALNGTFDPCNMVYSSHSPGQGHTPMSMKGGSNDWIGDPTGWGLPTMEFGSKAPVTQSLLSFSGDSMASGDDLVFSASSVSGSGVSGNASHNGSSASESVLLDGQGRGKGSGGIGKGMDGAFRGITIPIDDMDDFDFTEIDT